MIEWAGTQPWSNGKVGLTGVSAGGLSAQGAAHPPAFLRTRHDCAVRASIPSPYATPESRDAPEPVFALSLEHGMIIERNVSVPLRDGVNIFADALRPAYEQPAAPLIAWTPYGKRSHVPESSFLQALAAFPS